MSLKDKVKTGLDETRLLILGAQVLFGFQLNVVFQEGFTRLNPATRLIDSVAQGLMAIAIGLLIAPSMHHLIAEKGQDTLRLHRATGLFAGFALLPFAISLGLSFYIVFDRLYGTVAAVVAGTAFCLAALLSTPYSLDYDLWIGPAPMRPYDPSSCHFNWRYWWDFGGGTLADFGCHYMDLPFWALDLRYPTSVVAKGEKTSMGDNDVPDNMQVDYHFAARGKLPPVHLTWYHGKWRPEGAEMYDKTSAVLFEGAGASGRLLADYSTRKFFMLDGTEPDAPPQTIPNSIGHWAEWAAACKSRGPTTCNFDYSGALAEAVLLGNVSYRAGGQKLDWNAESLVATNCPDAAQYIRRDYRAGWSLEG